MFSTVIFAVLYLSCFSVHRYAKCTTDVDNGTGPIPVRGAEGVTLKNVVVQDNEANRSGGGAFSHQTKFTILNSTFKDNRAATGFLVEREPSAVETNPGGTDIVSNHAGFGGGIEVAGLIIRPTSLIVKDSEFIGNQAVQGGAIMLAGGSKLSVDGTLFKENKALKDDLLLIGPADQGFWLGRGVFGGVPAGGAIYIRADSGDRGTGIFLPDEVYPPQSPGVYPYLAHLEGSTGTLDLLL